VRGLATSAARFASGDRPAALSAASQSVMAEHHLNHLALASDQIAMRAAIAERELDIETT
jgi:hypothetical protein